MGDAGLLVANEIHARRVWELAENLERWGARDVMILNETSLPIAGLFRGLWTLPGEGCFTKQKPPMTGVSW
jgi:hypothetical protein